jgi:hypothetical protein
MKLKEKKPSNMENNGGFGGISFDPKSLSNGSPQKSAFEMPPGMDWGIPM